MSRVLLPAILAFALGRPSAACAQDGPATQHLRQWSDAASDARMHQLAGLPELSRRVLGPHWGQMSGAQQSEFVRLFARVVGRLYQRNLERLEEVRLLGEECREEGTIVHTQVRWRTRRFGDPERIDYVMRSEGGWAVIDVVADGVSLVALYRRQLHRIVSEHGLDDLLRRMRQRVASDSG